LADNFCLIAGHGAGGVSLGVYSEVKQVVKGSLTPKKSH
jgi:hypothetical protein